MLTKLIKGEAGSSVLQDLRVHRSCMAVLLAAGVQEGDEAEKGTRRYRQLHVQARSPIQVRDPLPEEFDHLTGRWML